MVNIKFIEKQKVLTFLFVNIFMMITFRVNIWPLLNSLFILFWIILLFLSLSYYHFIISKEITRDFKLFISRYVFILYLELSISLPVNWFSLLFHNKNNQFNLIIIMLMKNYLPMKLFRYILMMIHEKIEPDEINYPMVKIYILVS